MSNGQQFAAKTTLKGQQALAPKNINYRSELTAREDIMITVISIKDEHIANHFSKAESFIMVNEQASIVARFDNPALSEGCEGKRKLVELIKAHGATRVIVRNIGQQLLSKLLNQQLDVFHAKSGRTAITYFANEHLAECEPYLDALQGRPSTKHIAKQGKGGCCDHNHGESGCHGGHCDSHEHDVSDIDLSQPMHIKRCCQKKHSILRTN